VTNVMMRTPRRGLTVVEMLIVIFIVGLLAGITIPMIAARSSRADVGVARNDLRALASAQESWFYKHATYTTAIDSLAVTTSAGVPVTVREASPTGWSATAGACAVYFGDAVPLAPAKAPGQVTCR
jgi:prepilin-type N-terminal cleavage/methylation domain-containing protein